MMKRCIAFIMGTVLCVSAVCSQKELYVQAKTEHISMAQNCERAVRWIQDRRNENGSYGMDSIIKDTCQVEKLWRDMDCGEGNPWLEEKAEECQDNDSLARLYCATGNEDYLQAISAPNRDGGYGLTEDFASDVLDTALVLEALVRKNVSDGGREEDLSKVISYLSHMQMENGGFSWLPDTEADAVLTYRIGMSLWTAGESKTSVNAEIEEILKKIDSYPAKNFQSANAAESFLEATYRALYQCARGSITQTDELAESLTALQSEDGSYYGNLEATVAAVRLMKMIEEINKPRLWVTDMGTELSTYTAYIGFDTDIVVKSILNYQCNYDFAGVWKVEVLCNEQCIREETVSFTFTEGKTSKILEKTIVIHPEEGDSYQIRVSLMQGEELLYSTTENITVTEPVVDDIVLAAGEAGTDSVLLEWNDISNSYFRYGYRILRSCGDGEWESRSAWDGSEKVKVLNIYPCEEAREYLIDWMGNSLSGAKIPAGRELFDIDTVLVDNYNRNPYFYLLDEEGNYKYDVLFFGSYDAYAVKDLSGLSYRATQEFLDAGRGVLFGHDTITKAVPYFQKFAQQLGINLGLGNTYITSNKIKVVKSGVLTNYPWNIQGILEVPTTHASYQFVGGANKATVWMELVNGGVYDPKTDGYANGYLFSRNQLAMIQTGHSKGQASDDERKVLANTLFYLKQLTAVTSLEDKAAYDLENPGECNIQDVSWEEGGLCVSIDAVDYGTPYFYYIEAVPQTEAVEAPGKESNRVEVFSVSGIAGYEVCLDTSADACGEDGVWSSVKETESGKLFIGEEEIGEALYFHVRAVDRAGNAGKEAVILLPERKTTDWGQTGYALFAREEVDLYCSRADISGDIYAGRDILLNGSRIAVDGECASGGALHVYAGDVHLDSRKENVGFTAGPDWQKAVLGQSGREAAVPALWQKYDTQVLLDDTLICRGDISMGTGTATLGTEENIAVCSLEGNIVINASRLQGKGILYAPGGTITINVADMEFQGSIVAEQIIIQGSGIQITAQKDKKRSN